MFKTQKQINACPLTQCMTRTTSFGHARIAQIYDRIKVLSDIQKFEKSIKLSATFQHPDTKEYSVFKNFEKQNILLANFQDPDFQPPIYNIWNFGKLTDAIIICVDLPVQYPDALKSPLHELTEVINNSSSSLHVSVELIKPQRFASVVIVVYSPLCVTAK